VNHTSRTASFVGPANAAAITKPLPVFRTRKRSVRPASRESSSHQAHNVAETRAPVIGSDAFEEMFMASRSKFVAIARAILRNREDAEDAVQSAFLSGYRHLQSFQGRSALKTWFTRIVLNAALQIQRKRKPFTILALPENNNGHEVKWIENIPGWEPDPEMVHAEQETLQLMNGILGKMKPVLRQAFTMTYFDELSGPEVCAVLGVSLSTFKSRLFRARRQIFDQTERVLVAPIHKRTLSESEFLKRK
jgi:RNA polymerase sigma-70 factor (ECF subfamily)